MKGMNIIGGEQVRQIVNNSSLVAVCGLYCGACRMYLREKCPGCRENVKAGWCKLRSCGLERGYKSCAECVDYRDVNDCRKFNNAISKFFALVFRSNRRACIEQIRDRGIEEHAKIMAELKRHSLKR